MKKTAVLVLTAIIGLYAAACQAKTIELKNEELSTIFAKPGNKIIIKLDGNPTTGYRWKCSLNAKDTEVLKMIDGIYLPHKTKKRKVGTGGEYKFTYKVLKSDQAEINCTYARSWEKAPAKRIIYNVYVE